MNHFPFFGHRTMREVAETERLAVELSGTRGGGNPDKHRRLTELLAKAPDAEIYPLTPRQSQDESA